jgi:DNA-directed RNA polymerase subunit RPC12/RpoP
MAEKCPYCDTKIGWKGPRLEQKSTATILNRFQSSYFCEKCDQEIAYQVSKLELFAELIAMFGLAIICLAGLLPYSIKNTLGYSIIFLSFIAASIWIYCAYTHKHYFKK